MLKNASGGIIVALLIFRDGLIQLSNRSVEASACETAHQTKDL
jgi:hypothetical protein